MVLLRLTCGTHLAQRIGPAMVIQVAEIWICHGPFMAHILAARFSSPVDQAQVWLSFGLSG